MDVTATSVFGHRELPPSRPNAGLLQPVTAAGGDDIATDATPQWPVWFAPLLPLAAWIWLCRDWPARLGFFSDDWMVLLHPFTGTARAFRDTLNLVASRPVSAPAIWLAQVIVDWSPARSQILNAAMLLMTAFSVGILAATIALVARASRQGALAGACVASAAFIVFPSSVGTFDWATGMLAAVPAAPLFCLAMSLLLLSRGSPLRLCLGLALALMSHLSYEAFYFQEITIVLSATALGCRKTRDIPWRILAAAIVLNIGCLAFNRLIVSGIHKSFDPDFTQVFTYGYSRIFEYLGQAVREYRFLICSALIGAGLCGSICLARLVGFVRFQLSMLATIGGIVASGVLYAMAGYGLAFEGPMARVSIVIATYCSIASGVLAAASWPVSGRRRGLEIAFFGFAVTALVGLELVARCRVAEWADTWTFELARLSRLPAFAAPDDGGNRVYLAVEDHALTYVQPAAAPWEITGAVAWASYNRSPATSRLLLTGLWEGEPAGIRWFGTIGDWFNRWDGQQFQQGKCTNHAFIYGAPASQLWVWNTATTELKKVEAPWEIGCQ